MNRLLRGLKGHPGILPATAFVVFGAIAGGWGGAAIMSVWWGPVLLTAWSSGKRREAEGDE